VQGANFLLAVPPRSSTHLLPHILLCLRGTCYCSSLLQSLLADAEFRDSFLTHTPGCHRSSESEVACVWCSINSVSLSLRRGVKTISVSPFFEMLQEFQLTAAAPRAAKDQFRIGTHHCILVRSCMCECV
jgi:hypothetical protein